MRERHDVSLALIGRRGWIYEPVFALVQELRLSEYVRVVEHVPRRDFAAIYSPRWRSRFRRCMKGLGCRRSRRWPVARRPWSPITSSLPEVVGNAALLHEPLDTDALAGALVRLLEDDGLRRPVTSACAGVPGRQFTWTRAARETLAVYRAAAAR